MLYLDLIPLLLLFSFNSIVTAFQEIIHPTASNLKIRSELSHDFKLFSLANTDVENIEIRNWEDGEGKDILNLLQSVGCEFNESGFNPEGKLEMDCITEELLRESYPSDDDNPSCMLVAKKQNSEDTIVGTAGLVVGTPITYFKSGSSISSSKISGAIRRVCCDESLLVEENLKKDVILRHLLEAVEKKAFEASVDELIVLAYPEISTTSEEKLTTHQPSESLLKAMGYVKLSVIDSTDVIQYTKLMKLNDLDTSENDTTLKKTTEKENKINDTILGTALTTGLLLFAAAVVGVTSFMGLEFIPSDDNRGIGTPLSIQELQRLREDEKLQRTDLDGDMANLGNVRKWSDLSNEERQEEAAMMKIIQGQDTRLK